MRRAPGTGSVFAERVMGGNYVEFDIDRDAIARYGLTVGEVQEVLQVALGGMPLTTTVEGLERYGVILRYERDYRENLEALREILIPVRTGTGGSSEMGSASAAPAATTRPTVASAPGAVSVAARPARGAPDPGPPARGRPARGSVARSA